MGSPRQPRRPVLTATRQQCRARSPAQRLSTWNRDRAHRLQRGAVAGQARPAGHAPDLRLARDRVRQEDRVDREGAAEGLGDRHPLGPARAEIDQVGLVVVLRVGDLRLLRVAGHRGSRRPATRLHGLVFWRMAPDAQSATQPLVPVCCRARSSGHSWNPGGGRRRRDLPGVFPVRRAQRRGRERGVIRKPLPHGGPPASVITPWRHGVSTQPDFLRRTSTSTPQGGPTPITLSNAFPNRQATLAGRVRIFGDSHYFRLRGIAVEGHSADGPAVTISGDHISVAGADVTNSPLNACIVVGDAATGGHHGPASTAMSFTAVGESGHDSHDGVRLADADHAVVVHNHIYGAGSSAIELSPGAHDTTISHNVLDGNGRGIRFTGDEVSAASRNVVTENVITNSSPGYNLEHRWAGGEGGGGNTVSRNCLDGQAGHIQPGQAEIADDNYIGDPLSTGTDRRRDWR